MRRLLLLLIITAGSACTASAQLYTNQFRPAGQHWQELKTEHFRLLFPVSATDAAYRSARILESQYPVVQELTGGHLNDFPVILNSANDRSNGFVSPLNFRSEVELPPIKGKAMNPRSGGWLDLVLPHELVHALHLNANPAGLTSWIGLLSPDLRRTVHTAAPLGVLEGIAVQHESHGVIDGGGRGNYPFFTNRFRANFTGKDRWSIGQLFHISSTTLPYDRHYIGSYQFIHWLQNRYGEDVVRELIHFHYRWPFLGFGFALRNQTGHWPSSLYRSFTKELSKQEEMRVSSIPNPETPHTLQIGRYKGGVVRRPLWVDNETLLFHGSFYNAPTGFYTFHTESREMTLLLEHQSVEDYRFTIDRTANELHFADYITNGIYDNVSVSKLFRLNLETGDKELFSPENGLYGPAAGDPFLALQLRSDGNRLVSIDPEDGTLSVVTEPEPPDMIAEVLQHPTDNGLAAVIARRGNLQGLWITRFKDGRLHPDSNPDVAFRNGSVFDLDWHPSGDRLLFSSDHTGTLNIYEYDLSKNAVYQLTQSYYNAFEASYSPDGERITYSTNHRNHFLPVIQEMSSERIRTLPEGEWALPGITEQAHGQISVQEQPVDTEWDLQRYRTGINWLRPRTLLPLFRNRSEDGYEAGMQLLSTDLLGRHTYSAAFSRTENRLWYDIDYIYSGFYPGFGVNLYNRPSSAVISGPGSIQDIHSPFLQERGFSLHIPFRYTFQQNTRLTALQVIPEFSFSQVRFRSRYEADTPLTEFGDLYSASVQIILNYRIRQFRRDFQPNSGWVLFAFADADFNDYPFQFQLDHFNISGVFGGREGIRMGIINYISPLKFLNQSLKTGLQFLTQTNPGIYNPGGIISNAFNESVFPEAYNLGFLDLRYTIPLAYPDDGGLLIPAYLSNVYLVLFSQTIGDLDDGDFQSIFRHSRTAMGAGIRTRVRLSNFTIDIGAGVGYDTGRNQWRFMLGPF